MMEIHGIEDDLDTGEFSLQGLGFAKTKIGGGENGKVNGKGMGFGPIKGSNGPY